MHSERQNEVSRVIAGHPSMSAKHTPEATSSYSSLADDIDRDLAAAGLPAEHIVDGSRRCRHHPEHAIRSRGEPCPECWRAARGMLGPVVQLQPDAEGVAR
jgi:hypothetical protein